MNIRYCNCYLNSHASFIYRIRYRIRYHIRYQYTIWWAILDLYSRMLSPGPAPQPSAAPSDAGDNPHWNSDDERDFQDQQYSPPSPMSHYPGSLNPLVSFLSHILDWNSFDKSALDHALQGLQVPIPGPAPHGISLQEAIKVSPLPHALRHRIRYRIRNAVLPSFWPQHFSVRHIVPGGPLSIPLGTLRRFRSVDWFWYDWWWWCLVCTTSTVFFVQPVPYWTNGRQGFSCGIFACVLQHIWTNLSHPWQLHAAEWHSNAVRAGCLPASNTLCLPCGKRSRPCPADAVLPQREPSQHYSSFFASCSSCWRCCRFQARQRDRQQAFWGQHLYVLLWESIPQKDLCGGCGGDAAEACPRSKT